jgi:sec-independent protein translocase protein TatC
LRFLQAVGGPQLVTIYNPNQYLSLFLLVMFVFGLSFEFPVLLVALELAGLVTPKQLLHWWRYAIALIVIVAAIITPSPDPLSMFFLAIPLIVFYFLSIAAGKLLRK